MAAARAAPPNAGVRVGEEVHPHVGVVGELRLGQPDRRDAERVVGEQRAQHVAHRGVGPVGAVGRQRLAGRAARPARTGRRPGPRARPRRGRRGSGPSRGRGSSPRRWSRSARRRRPRAPRRSPGSAGSAATRPSTTGWSGRPLSNGVDSASRFCAASSSGTGMSRSRSTSVGPDAHLGQELLRDRGGDVRPRARARRRRSAGSPAGTGPWPRAPRAAWPRSSRRPTHRRS